MKRVSGKAALAAAFFTVFLPFPMAGGVHLVSNQPTGTDNQNNAPVQYAPKMATKLGLPPSSNREPEYFTGETLASAFRQLLESHKRQTTFLERLVTLAPKFKEEELQPKRKTCKPQSKSPSKKSDSSSVIMRAPTKTPEIAVPPEKEKSVQADEKVNRTEINPEDVDISQCPPWNQLPRSRSTLHRRSYLRPVQHTNIGDPQVINSQFVGPSIQTTQLPQNAYPNRATAASSGQDSLTLQNSLTNSAALLQNHPFQNQYSYNVAVTSPGQNPTPFQNPHKGVASIASYIQNPYALKDQFPHNVPDTSPSQSPITLSSPHSHVISTESNIQNPYSLQNLYSHNVVTSPSQNALKLQNPYTQYVSIAPYIQNTHALENQYSQNVALPFPPPQSPVNPENPHSPVLGVAPHNPHASQNPHSSNFNKPSYNPLNPANPYTVDDKVNQNKPQSPHLSMTTFPLQSKNPLTIHAGSQPDFVDEAPQDQDLRMLHIIQNYDSLSPVRRNLLIPQGYQPYQITKTPQIPNSLSF